jgi:hypothetical protein
VHLVGCYTYSVRPTDLHAIVPKTPDTADYSALMLTIRLAEGAVHETARNLLDFQSSF